MVTARGAEVPFNQRQRAASLRRQITDMELRMRNLRAHLNARRAELRQIEQETAQAEGEEREE